MRLVLDGADNAKELCCLLGWSVADPPKSRTGSAGNNSGREDLKLRPGPLSCAVFANYKGGSPWSRTRFKFLLKSVEICCS